MNPDRARKPEDEQAKLPGGPDPDLSDRPLGQLAVPHHGSERLARGLATVDEAMCAAVDAEVQRRRAAGEKADPSRFRDDGRDPLGTGFAWAGGAETKKAEEIDQGQHSGQLGTGPTYGELDHLTVSPSERLTRGLGLVDDAMCEAVDSQVAADLAAGAPTPPDRRGPDPLGVNLAREGGADITNADGVEHGQQRGNRPHHGSERLARALASIDDARLAAVDAAVQRRLAAGEKVDPSRFRDDGPDPLGTGFAWAGGGSKK